MTKTPKVKLVLMGRVGVKSNCDLPSNHYAFVTGELCGHLTDGKGGLLIGSKWPEDPFYGGEAFGEIIGVNWLHSEIRTVRIRMNSYSDRDRGLCKSTFLTQFPYY